MNVCFLTDARTGAMTLRVGDGDDGTVFDAAIECCKMGTSSTIADPERSTTLCFLARELYRHGNTTPAYWAAIKEAIARSHWAWIQSNAHDALGMVESALVEPSETADAMLFPPFSLLEYDLRSRTGTTNNQFGTLIAKSSDVCIHLWLLPLLLAFNPTVLQLSEAERDAFYRNVADACSQCFSAALTCALVRQRYSVGMRTLVDRIATHAIATHVANVARIGEAAAAGASLPPPINIVAVAHDAHRRRRRQPATAEQPATADQPAMAEQDKLTAGATPSTSAASAPAVAAKDVLDVSVPDAAMGDVTDSDLASLL